MSTRQAFAPTPTTIGNYELIEKIAEGGMGSIHKARHRDSGQVVAIKVMPTNLANNSVLLKRFEQEFRAASRLDHPHVVRALEYGENGSYPYLVMEFVDGESLGRKIQRDGRLSEPESVRLITQVAQGLHKAHRLGMIHRDVKPDNILLTQDCQAKLADLGLVKEMETDLNLTRTGRGLGTPHFMAPEQFRNAKNADVRCDIYSLGATLYMMVTGKLPFESTGPLDAWMKKINNDMVAPRQIVPTLSERMDWAIRRAMHPDPDARPASCREFVEDLIGQSTRKTEAATSTPGKGLWYLVYRDDEGAAHSVKGSTSAIRRSFKEGLLGDAMNVRAGRSRQGPFEPLRTLPQFRDLVIIPPESAQRGEVDPDAETVRRGPGKDRDSDPVLASLDSTADSVRRASHKTPTDARASVNWESTNHPPLIEVQRPQDRKRRSSPDWWTWIFLTLVALGSFVAAWYFLFRFR